MRTRAKPLLLVAVAIGAACASDQRPTLQPSPSTPPTTVVPSPDDVKAGIRKGLSSVRNFRAEVVARHYGIERRTTLEMTADGRVRETEKAMGPNPERVTVTDAGSGIWRGQPGQPAGRPPEVDIRPGVDDNPLRLARHVLDWEHFGVATTTVEGRPAWVVQWSAPKGLNPDYVAVTIDMRSGLALRAEGFFENQPVYDVQVVSLEIDTDVSITAPPITAEPAPPGVTPRVISGGYRPTSIEEAAALAGYRPVVPSWLPPGFAPAEVAFAVEARSATAFTNPDGTHIVSAAYRRGLDELVITTRRRGSRPWKSPIQQDRPSAVIEVYRFEPATVSTGAFAGAEAARSTLAPYGQSLFWALNEQLHLEAQGDVTVEEMQRIVESLRPL